MAKLISRALVWAAVFAYGVFTMILYGAQALVAGYFFRRTSEKERLELQLARNTFWDLSKKWSGLSHQILTLRNGFKFHYVCNDLPGSDGNTKPLVIFIHGYPDSWAIWRYVISSASLQQTASIVAVDLPGFGGSEGLGKYSATSVLENLTEFIITMRMCYGVENDAGVRQKPTVIVAHDWGCAISMRLAAEAPELADRFILSNGPLIGHVFSNVRRRVSSAVKITKTALRSPVRNFWVFGKALGTLKPVFLQLLRSGYIFAFQLPMPLVQYLGEGGNQSFLKLCHKISHGNSKFTSQHAAECMASTMGPSIEECKTQTDTGDSYAESVKDRALSNFTHMTSYYRDGCAIARWDKSVETIAALHAISQGEQSPRGNSGAGLFNEGPPGALRARATLVWGKKDFALNEHICLDGISDYLGTDSQVVELSHSGHFTPLEQESQVALEKVAEWAAKGEREDIATVLQDCYPDAVVKVRK